MQSKVLVFCKKVSKVTARSSLCDFLDSFEFYSGTKSHLAARQSSVTQMAPGAAGLAPPLPLVRSQELGRASTQSMGLGQGKWGDPQIMLYKQTRQPDVQSGDIKFGVWQGRRGGLLKWEGVLHTS